MGEASHIVYPKVFGMVHTKHSTDYTALALHTFFRCTPFQEHDRFYLVANDGEECLRGLNIPSQAAVIVNKERKGFAQNLNTILEMANEAKADLYFLNNDLVFTPSWLAPLAEIQDAICSPVSNSQFQYKAGAFSCVPFMELNDYQGNEETLIRIAQEHCDRNPGASKVISLPFFCVKIPYRVQNVVGKLDEQFGLGGAEDRDYCIRVYLAGFSVHFALNSYVLHFQGKSTWRGPESAQETQERDAKYIAAFERKWGRALAQLLIFNDQSVWRNPELESFARSGNFKRVLERLVTT